MEPDTPEIATNALIEQALETAQEARRVELREGSAANQDKARALALVVMKLEEAQMWLMKAL